MKANNHHILGKYTSVDTCSNYFLHNQTFSLCQLSLIVLMLISLAKNQQNTYRQTKLISEWNMSTLPSGLALLISPPAAESLCKMWVSSPSSMQFHGGTRCSCLTWCAPLSIPLWSFRYSPFFPSFFSSFLFSVSSSMSSQGWCCEVEF